MKINRHNYEEFFLMYVDNELSAEDRKAVEVFVQENPDLQGELQMLQQTIMKADHVVLEKKDWLFMEEEIPVLQENLLLYADDELPAPDKKAVEALLATDKAAQAEWNILRKTKLQPDASVVFADKRSLYRTEAGRVVVFRWWRVAAAAVLLGIGLWTGLSVYRNSTNPASAEETAKGNEIKNNQPADKASENSNIARVQPDNMTVPQNTDAGQKNAADPGAAIKQTVQKPLKQDEPGKEDNIAAEKNNPKPSNNLPKPYFENINNSESNRTAVANVKPENDNSPNNSGNNGIIAKTNPNEKITNPVVDISDKNEGLTNTAAIPAVNKTGDEDNARYLDIDESKGKRTLLGGIIRKAKRMIERTTNNKNGNGIKVAGFEIALK